MQEYLMTDRLVLHRHIVQDGCIFDALKNGLCQSCPKALSDFIKKNRQVMHAIFGWWSDIASPYSAKRHIKIDDKFWNEQKQIQYYVYEKETQNCIGIYCALIEDKTAYILAWLSKSAQSKGYSSEIVKKMDNVLFQGLSIDKIKYKCFKHNQNLPKVAALLKSSNYLNPIEDEVSFTWLKTKEEYLNQSRLINEKQKISTPIIMHVKIVPINLSLQRE